MVTFGVNKSTEPTALVNDPGFKSPALSPDISEVLARGRDYGPDIGLQNARYLDALERNKKELHATNERLQKQAMADRSRLARCVPLFPLLDLPAILLQKVCGKLDVLRDMVSLILVCKATTSACIPMLYRLARQERFMPRDIYCDRTMKPLHSAAKEGEKLTVQRMVEYGGAVDERNENTKATALHIAARYGRKGVVKVLLKMGAAVDTRDSDGKTPLHYALDLDEWDLEKPSYCLSAQKCVLEILVANGADVNAMLHDNNSDMEDSDNEYEQSWITTPLYHLLEDYGENPAIIALFLRKGADPNVIQGARNVSLLHYAASGLFSHKSSFETFQLLVDHGAKLNTKSKKMRWNFLHYAMHYHTCCEDYLDCLKFLLRKITDVNEVDKSGSTALHLLFTRIRIRLCSCVTGMLMVLLTHGADHTICNKDGDTALALAKKRKLQAGAGYPEGFNNAISILEAWESSFQENFSVFDIY